MLKYNGSGVCVASILIHTNIFLVIVWQEGAVQPYVVSKYENESTEREPGRYFSDYSEAINYFARQIQGWSYSSKVMPINIGPQ